MIAERCHYAVAQGERFVYVESRTVGTAAAEPTQKPTSANATYLTVENMAAAVRGWV
jgi:hypothetical protein